MYKGLKQYKELPVLIIAFAVALLMPLRIIAACITTKVEHLIAIIMIIDVIAQLKTSIKFHYIVLLNTPTDIIFSYVFRHGCFSLNSIPLL